MEREADNWLLLLLLLAFSGPAGPGSAPRSSLTKDISKRAVARLTANRKRTAKMDSGGLRADSAGSGPLFLPAKHPYVPIVDCPVFNATMYGVLLPPSALQVIPAGPHSLLFGHLPQYYTAVSV